MKYGICYVILKDKFHSFLVRILIQKDDTNNKVFKKEFYTKETRKKEVEKMETYLRECLGNKVL